MSNQNETAKAYHNGALVTVWPNMPCKPGFIVTRNQHGATYQAKRADVRICKGGKP